MIPTDSPFHPDNGDAYLAWREAKLAGYPVRGEDLVVRVCDPYAPTRAEADALWRLIAKTNMAVYATDLGESEDKQAVRALSRHFGLQHLDANWLADEDGISSLTPRDEDSEPDAVRAPGTDPGKRGDYIPYTHHRIRWHTDGYYNPPARRIWAMTLHCVRQADSGGENDLYDHELAYIALRDHDPAHIRALMAEDAMTIPSRTDERGTARGDETGPAFTVEDGRLHLRYTARTRSIAWKQDAATQGALAALEDILAARPFGAYTLRLMPGMGLICNNVLHTRSGFSDTASHRRLLYRARYHDHLRAPAPDV